LKRFPRDVVSQLWARIQSHIERVCAVEVIDEEQEEQCTGKPDYTQTAYQSGLPSVRRARI
jgi:hypothetical protein